MPSKLELEDLRDSYRGMIEDAEDLPLSKLTLGDLRYLLHLRDLEVSDSELPWERELLREFLLKKGNE